MPHHFKNATSTSPPSLTRIWRCWSSSPHWKTSSGWSQAPCRSTRTCHGWRSGGTCSASPRGPILRSKYLSLGAWFLKLAYQGTRAIGRVQGGHRWCSSVPPSRSSACCSTPPQTAKSGLSTVPAASSSPTGCLSSRPSSSRCRWCGRRRRRAPPSSCPACPRWTGGACGSSAGGSAQTLRGVIDKLGFSGRSIWRKGPIRCAPDELVIHTSTKATSCFGALSSLMKKMLMIKMRVVVVVAMMMMIIPAPEGKRPAFWNWEFFELQ